MQGFLGHSSDSLTPLVGVLAFAIIDYSEARIRCDLSLGRRNVPLMLKSFVQRSAVEQ